MKHFILTTSPGKNGIIRLEGEDYHYLVRVRRLSPGKSFSALLPSGEKAVVRLTSIDGGVLTGECTMEQAGSSVSGISAGRERRAKLPPVILFQALPKGEKMDLIVRQAAETGLTEIYPFRGEFSIPKIKRKEDKLFRWQRIIKEARQQSGSPAATVVHEPMSSDELFACWEALKNKGALGLLFHQIPLENASLHGYLDNNTQLVVLAIGPEGGFSNSELSRFMEAGFKSFTVGDTVLRTETAALYAAAAIQIILLERDSWEMKQRR